MISGRVCEKEKKAPYEWVAQTLWNNEFKDWLQALTPPCDEHRQTTKAC